MNEITKGTVVRYKNEALGIDGWLEVKAKFKNTVNLGSIFGSKTRFKGIPIADVKPDYDAWYESWSKSEAYQSM